MDNLSSLEKNLLDNPAPRCPCLLLLDTSGSMQGKPLTELGDAVGQFISEVQLDERAAYSVELSIVTFGGQVTEAQPFMPMVQFDSRPAFNAMGETPLGGAIELAIRRLEERKNAYQQAGVSYYQPWVVVMSDGAPTDSMKWKEQAARLKVLAEQKKAVVLCIGIGDDADLNTLGQCAVMTPKKLQGLRFSEFFSWLSESMARVSASTPGDRVTLSATNTWDSIAV
ncbi:VWA domain-containing protein [Plesiomonas shigelloides]|uniref:vWA domain-containing protein n=1 Tax=Plesiomonas shigelloides TaxID=703 RepID=UPI000D58157A|nr:VWA domain-containing protein [Plesiomonas shigelloides]PVU65611.1 glycosyl transferase family 2 [Plesiomonas shigelloides]